MRSITQCLLFAAMTTAVRSESLETRTMLEACLANKPSRECVGIVERVCLAAPELYPEAANSNQQQEWCVRAEIQAWRGAIEQRGFVVPVSSCPKLEESQSAPSLYWFEEAECVRNGLAAFLLRKIGG